MLNFSQFIAKYAPNSPVATELQSLFINHPPHTHFLPKSSRNYPYPQTMTLPDLVRCAVLEKAIHTIHLSNPEREYLLSEKIIGVSVDFFEEGDPKLNKAQHKYVCFLNAGFFKFTQLGQCRFRACFAAIELVKALPADIIVAIKNAPDKDHFVVMLGNKRIGFYVFDPLVNPTVVFELKEWRTEVLSKFDHSTKQVAKFDRVVTKQDAEDFERQWPTLEQGYLDLVTKQGYDRADFVNDQLFLNFQQRHNIKPSLLTKTLDQSLKKLKKFAEQYTLTASPAVELVDRPPALLLSQMQTLTLEENQESNQAETGTVKARIHNIN